MNHVTDLKELYAAFGRGEVPTVLDAMHPEIEWSEAEGNPYMSDGIPFIGPQEILNKLFVRLNEEWNDFTVTPETYHDAGETVVVEGRYSGSFKATGRENNAPFCHVWRYDGDKIRKFQQYTNTAGIQEAMGVASAVTSL